MINITTFNSRTKALAIIALCLSLLAVIFVLNFVLSADNLNANLMERNLAPSFKHIVGTDWLGRDMLTRIIKGLYASFWIGLLSATASSVIALMMGLVAAAFGAKTDFCITVLIDMFLSVPHIVLLILIAFACGGGQIGIVIAVAVSHWPRLARIIRAEILQLKTADYIQLAAKLGRGRLWIILHHMTAHVLQQVLIGLLLMFPHAILHAAGLAFLGFGLSPDKPCIGILIAESMRHLATGLWWLAVFPGAALVFMLKLFDIIGHRTAAVLNPRRAQE